MRISDKLANPEKGSVYEKILEGHTFDLNKISWVLSEIKKDNIIDYQCMIGFTQANFMVIPVEIVQNPKKLRTIMIGKKVFSDFTHLKAQFMTSEEVEKRALKWLDNWDKLASRARFMPTVVVSSDKGWLWCTNQNFSVPEEIIEQIENYKPEQDEK